MKYYKCGHIMTTRGIKGELKVKSYSDFDRFSKGKIIYILHNDEYVKEEILKSSFNSGYYYVVLKDKEDINLVEKYHSNDIYVSELEREKLDEGEYYYSELVGKKVINQNGEDRGKVFEIREYPKSDYLAINYNDKVVLVPFIDEFVKEVLDDKIIVNEIEGLF
ncbi:MAG: 16S rRNA processing protein RimM [Acholeplasmatales bacterium]|nr:16S rRNA processing protein RimM [Acholeplasmatales bacterium]